MTCPSEESWLEDLEKVINFKTRVEGEVSVDSLDMDVPVILVGVGFGATLILNFLAKYQREDVKGICLINPMLEVDYNLNTLEKFFTQIFQMLATLEFLLISVQRLYLKRILAS